MRAMVRGPVGASLLLVLGILLLPTSSLANYRRDLGLADRALAAALAALKKDNATCRQGLNDNLVHLRGTLRDLKLSATEKTIEDARLFLSGIALGGALASCSASVMTEVNRAAHFLTTAKQRWQNGEVGSEDDDDDEEEDRPRSRRRSASKAGGLAGAVRDLEDAEEALDEAGKKCRNGIEDNLAVARRKAKTLSRKLDRGALRGFNGFLAGLVLAGGLSGCPEEVMEGLKAAHEKVHGELSRQGAGGSDGERRDVGKYVKRAGRDLEDARDALDDAGKACREGLRGNLKRALRSVEDLEENPRPADLKDTTSFVAGLVVAGGLAGCPSDMMSDLKSALRNLKKTLE